MSYGSENPKTEPLGAYFEKSNGKRVSVENLTGDEIREVMTGLPILKALKERFFGKPVNRRMSLKSDSDNYIVS